MSLQRVAPELKAKALACLCGTTYAGSLAIVRVAVV